MRAAPSDGRARRRRACVPGVAGRRSRSRCAGRRVRSAHRATCPSNTMSPVDSVMKSVMSASSRASGRTRCAVSARCTGSPSTNTRTASASGFADRRAHHRRADHAAAVERLEAHRRTIKALMRHAEVVDDHVARDERLGLVRRHAAGGAADHDAEVGADLQRARRRRQRDRPTGPGQRVARLHVQHRAPSAAPCRARRSRRRPTPPAPARG